jgi:hypothetical protein
MLCSSQPQWRSGAWHRLWSQCSSPVPSGPACWQLGRVTSDDGVRLRRRCRGLAGRRPSIGDETLMILSPERLMVSSFDHLSLAVARRPTFAPQGLPTIYKVIPSADEVCLDLLGDCYALEKNENFGAGTYLVASIFNNAWALWLSTISHIRSCEDFGSASSTSKANLHSHFLANPLPLLKIRLSSSRSVSSPPL